MAARYDAFISYSHAADGKLAPALQRELQRFAKPWYRTRALHLFRDETSLTATPGLWPAIVDALRASTHFLLLASPRAAHSVWVQREVDWWLAHKSPQTLLIALTDGQIKRQSGAKDFDWTLTDALPRNLTGVFTENPRWVDLRGLEDPAQLTTRNSAFQNALAEIAGPLRGVSKEELIGEEVRQHLRTRQTVTAAAAVLVVLALLATLFGFKSRVEETAARRSNSRLFSEQATIALEEDIELAALLSRAAFAAMDTPAARKALLANLAHGPIASLGDGDRVAVDVQFLGQCSAKAGPLGQFDFDSPRIHDLAFSPDGTRVASVDDDRFIRIWQIPGTSSPSIAVNSSSRITNLGFSEDGVWLLTGATEGAMRWDATTMLTGCLLSDKDVTSFAVSPDGSTMYLGDGLGAVARVDIAARATELLPELSRQDRVQDIKVSPDGWLAVGFNDGAIVVQSPHGGSPRTLGTPSGADANSAAEDPATITRLAWHPSRPLLAVADDGGEIVLRNTEDPNAIEVRRTASRTSINDLQFSTDGSTLASADNDGQVVLWQMEPWKKLRTLTAHDVEPITSIAFNPDGSLLVSGSQSGQALIWSVSSPALACQALPQLNCAPPRTDGIGATTAVAFDPSSDRLAIAGDERMIRICQMTAVTLDCEEPFSVTAIAPALAFSRDGDSLAIAAAPGRIAVRGRTGETIHILAPEGFVAEQVTFSADGSWLFAYGRAHRVQDETGRAVEEMSFAWNLETPGERHPLLFDDAVSAFAFNPDDSTLVVGQGNQLTAWQTTNGTLGSQRGFAVPGVTVLSMAFDGRGDRIATGNADGSVTIWRSEERTPTWHPSAEISETSAGGAEVRGLAFSPDGRYLASGSASGDIRLWDVDNQDGTGSLGSVGAPILGLDWSGSRALVAVDARGTVTTFDVDPRSWSRRVCAVSGRDLHQNESIQFFGEDSHAVCRGAFAVAPAAPVPGD